MSQCLHHKMKPGCKGDVRRTPHGMLCHTHAYIAFLRARCGLDVHEDSYVAVRENVGTMFAGRVEDGE